MSSSLTWMTGLTKCRIAVFLEDEISLSFVTWLYNFLCSNTSSDTTLAHIRLSPRHVTIVPYSYNNLLIAYYSEVFLRYYRLLMFISTELRHLHKISSRLVWWVCRDVLTFEVTGPVDPAPTLLKSFLNIC